MLSTNAMAAKPPTSHAVEWFSDAAGNRSRRSLIVAARPTSASGTTSRMAATNVGEADAPGSIRATNEKPVWSYGT
jgi:hypothetical protein